MPTLLLEGPAGPFPPETLLGALCDLGASPSSVEWELGKLPLAPYHLHFERGGDGGVRFTVHPGAVHTHDQDEDAGGHAHAHHDHGHEHGDDGHEHHDHEEEEDGHEHGHEHEETALTDVVELVENSDLSPFVRTRAVAALGGLGEDFDEDDALTAVVCVVGVLAAAEALEIDAVAVAEGGGAVGGGGSDRVGAALLKALGARAATGGGRVLKTGIGLGRREGETLNVKLVETA